MRDFTEIFDDPEELADFVLLDPQEQDRVLAELAMKGKIKGAAVVCEVGKGMG